MSCVSPTIKQMQQFKELQHKYDLHETTLESIVHEWINIEGNENTFPSDSFIQERIQGNPTMNASEAQIELWNKYYSKPIVVDTMEEAINIQDASTEYFDEASIKVIRTEDEKYKVTVAEPFDMNGLNSEMRSIKEKAVADGTFMKAPNDKPTNLTERQWLQVRTKNFINWFGDWINVPENASKVVDENGEPLVVYHNTYHPVFDTFDIEKIITGGGFWFSESKNEYGPNTISAFLNIKNPYSQLKEYLFSGGFDPLMERTLTLSDTDNDPFYYRSREEVLEQVEKGYDGEMKHGYYRVNFPNQIKSATDNVGSFSREINNIFKQDSKEIAEERKRLSDFKKIREVIYRKTSKSIDFATMNVTYRDIMKDANAIKNRIIEAIHQILPEAKVNVVVSSYDYYTHVDEIKINGYDLLNEINRIERAELIRKNSEIYNKYKTNEQRLSEQALIEQEDYFDFMEDGDINAYKQQTDANLVNAVENVEKSSNITDLYTKSGRKYTYLRDSEAAYFKSLIDEQGNYPKQFILKKRSTQYSRSSGNSLKFKGENIYKKYIYQKANNNKRSLLYNIVDAETGEVVASKVRLIYDVETATERIGNSLIDRSSGTKIYSDKRSANFALYRQMPNESKAKAIMKQYIYEAIKLTHSDNINLDKIVSLVDRFPEAIWKYVNVSLMDFGERNEDINAQTSLRNNIVFQMSKLGLISKFEEKYGIQLNGRKLANWIWIKGNPIKTLDVTKLSRKQVQQAIADILNQEGILKATSEEENIRHYAEDTGQSIKDIQEFLNEEDSNVETAPIKEFIRNYNWQYYKLLEELNNEYTNSIATILRNKFNDKLLNDNLSYLEYFFSGKFNWIDIAFNRTSVDETNADVYNRIAAILHEPMHALHALTYGTAEERALYNSFLQLKDTELGKALIKQLALDNYKNNPETVYKEFVAYFTQLILTPEALQLMPNLRSTEIAEFINNVKNAKYNDKEIIITATEDVKLNFIQKLYNYLVKALYNVIPFTKNLVSLIDETKLNTRIERIDNPETVRNKEFLSAIDDFQANIETLLQIDESSFDLNNVDKFFTNTSYRQETVGLTPTTQESKKKLTDKQQRFMDYQTRFLQQMENLTNFVDERLKKLGMDGRLTKKMVQEFSEDVGYMMSDYITWCLNGKPENGGVNKNFLFDTFSHIENTQKLREELPNMSRLDLVNLVGIDNLINAVRKNICNGSQYTLLNMGFVGKLNENWDAVMRMASFVFNANEDFSILLVSDKKTVKDKQSGENVNVDDYNSQDNSQVREEVEDIREHWQIDNNTRDIVDDLKKDVKDAISKSIEISNQGQPILNYWGKPRRVDLRSAVKQIINATQGCGNISEMVAMLKENRDNMPWIDDILRRLDDVSGSETIFQSNFYRTFKKKKASYNSTYNDGGVLTNIIMNASKASREILKAAQNLKKAGEHPLFTNRGIDESLFKRLKDVSDKLNEYVSSKKGDANSLIKQAVEMLLGSVEESEKITDFENTGVLLDQKDIENMATQLGYIINTLEKKIAEKDINYDPFEYVKQQEGVEQKDYGIRSNLTKFIAPLTAKLASISIDTVYNNGKTYQTNVTPSWLDLFLDAMHSPEKLQVLIDTKFGISEWFANTDGTFRNTWLDAFVSSPEEFQEKLLQHHIDLDYNGKRYMKEMTPEDYLMSTIVNYFREGDKSQIGWFPIPTIGNKPSNEFVSFLRYKGFSRESLGVNWYNGNDTYSENDVLVVFERADGNNIPNDTPNILRQKAVGNYSQNNISRNEMDRSLITQLIDTAKKNPNKVYKMVNLENALFSHQDMVRKILSEYPEIKRIPNIQFNSNDVVGLLGYGQKKVIDGMVRCFDQEMSRIQTCLMRQQNGIKKGDGRFIKSWDDRGRSFCFLPYFNKFLTTDGLTNDSDIRFANIIKTRLDGKKDTLSSEDLTWFKKELESRLALWMDERTINILKKWKDEGIFQAAAKVKGLSENQVERMQQLSEFIWNNTLAQINMTQLFAVDKAFFRNEEELQKRMPQIHAPGERVNTQALVFDTKNNPYSINGRVSADGKLRTTVLKDFDDVVSTIKDNVDEVFKRKLQSYKEGTREYAMAKQVFDDIVSSFDKINVADAQAYVSLTGIRKIAYMTGNWDTTKENVYQRIQRNEYDYKDLITLSEVIKPFAFDQILESTRVPNAPITQMPVPMQQKNSVYLITMAGAILSNEQTTKPNMLKVLERIMEESAYDNRKYDKNGNIVEQGTYNGKGIDIIQFESAIKCGLEGTTNLNQFVNGENVRNSENGAYSALKSRLYNIDGTGRLQVNADSYNDAFVRATDFSNWCIQQEVSDHFNDHEQIDGSQQRAIIPSDLESTYLGTPVSYNFEEAGIQKSLSAREFKQHWEEVQARNIELSFQELSEEFGLEGDFIDKNIALSELLQNEIMNNLQRYGLDLLNAVSLDENFKFRLPLGDPIMSKRIEQLLNAMIKNRINKQLVDGGPVVQVSNFGVSKELNIVFNDINGNRLQTFKEWKENNNRTDEEGYKQYLKDNQGGIAYMEVFVSMFDDRLKKFMDENGIIDINKMKERLGEKEVDEMLTMLGYRIPTEDKYSIIPMKIIGFLPAESGSAIMMANDITLLTGSDFDVDKMYLKRKSYDWHLDYKALKQRLFDFIKGNFKTLENKEVAEMVDDFLKDPEGNKDKDVWSKAMYKIYTTENFDSFKISDTGRKGNNNTIINMSLAVLNHPSTLDKMLNPGNFEPEKRLGYMIDAFKHSNKSWEELQSMSVDELKEVNKTPKDLSWIDTMVDFYAQNKAASTALGMAAVQKSAHALLESDGWCLATPKSLSAYPNRKLDRRTFEFISGKVISQEDFDTFISLMQNKDNKEASILEAQAKYPELYDIYRKYTMEDKTVLPILRIGDNIIGGSMEVDKKASNDGVTLIGRTLGEFVGMFADAVKDPVANLMNINNQTMPVVTTLIRLGMSLEDTALFIAQSSISNILDTISQQSVQGFSKSLTATIKSRIEEIESIEKNSINGLKFESITKQELIRGLRDSDVKIEYKVLNALAALVDISNEMKSLTLVTRLNSISSAAGPLIIDNLIMQRKLNDFTAQLLRTSDIYDPNLRQNTLEDVLNAHPMLKAFSNVYLMDNEGNKPLADRMFEYSPLSKNNVFYDMIDSWGVERNVDLFQNRTVLNKLADFYLSMMAYNSNAIRKDKSTEYYINEFPKEFFAADYKNRYKDNTFIQATMRNMERTDTVGGERLVIKIDFSGLDESRKEKLRNGWSDLAFENPELAYDLFCYAYYKGGMGFNPKSFMALLPENLRRQYYQIQVGDTTERLYDSPNRMSANRLIRTFLQNNAQDTSIVRALKEFDGESVGYNPDGTEIYYTENEDLRGVMAFRETSDVKNMYVLSDIKLEGDYRGMVFEKVPVLGNYGEFMEFTESPTENTIFANDNPFVQDSDAKSMLETMESEETMYEANTGTQLELFSQEETIDLTSAVAKELNIIENDEANAEMSLAQQVDMIHRNLTEQGLNVTKEQVEKTIEEINAC